MAGVVEQASEEQSPIIIKAPLTQEIVDGIGWKMGHNKSITEDSSFCNASHNVNEPLPQGVVGVTVNASTGVGG